LASLLLLKREREGVTKERLLLFSKREIKRANQEDIMLALSRFMEA